MDDLLAFAPVGKLQLDGEISCMAVLSERTFFVGFESGVVQFWEPESNSHSGFLPCPYRSKWSIFFTEKVHKKKVTCCCVNLKEDILVTGSQDAMVMLWLLPEKRRNCFVHQSPVVGVSISLDSSILYTLTAEHLISWDPLCGSQLNFVSTNGTFLSLAILPPNPVALTSKSLLVWDQKKRTLSSVVKKTFTVYEIVVKWGTKNPMVVTGNENGLIQFWDPTTGTNWDLIQSIQGGNQIDFICVSPDQMKICVGEQYGRIAIFSTTGTLLKHMELPLGLSQNVNACWSLDGSVIFLYNLDTIYFYEVDVQDLTLLQGFCTWNSFKGIQYALAAFPQSYKEFSLLTKETALFQACRTGNIMIFEALIAKGSDLSMTNFKGNIPLHIAAVYGITEMVSQLVKLGSKIDFQNKKGSTPLHLAASNQRLETCELLCQLGSFVNCQNNRGESPLHIAVEQKNGPLVEILLLQVVNVLIPIGRIGGNPTLLNKSGMTPLDLAKERLPKHSVKRLLQKISAIYTSKTKSVVSVDLSHCQLTSIPKVVLMNEDLQKLDLSSNRIEYLPATLKSIPSLKSLKLEGNPLTCFGTSDPLNFLRNLTTTQRWKDYRMVILGDAKIKKSFLKQFGQKIKVKTEFEASFSELEILRFELAFPEPNPTNGPNGPPGSTPSRKASPPRSHSPPPRSASPPRSGSPPRPSSGNFMSFSLWNFDDTILKYGLYNSLVTSRTVHLIPFNLSSFDPTHLSLCLQQIKSSLSIRNILSTPPVFLVAIQEPHTTKGEVKECEKVIRQLSQRYHTLGSFMLPLNSAGIDTLLEQMTAQLTKWKFPFIECPRSYIMLKRRLDLERQSNRLMNRQKFDQICVESGIELKETSNAADFLLSFGHYISIRSRKGSVFVLQPDWFLHHLSRVFMPNADCYQNGLISISYLQSLFGEIPDEAKVGMIHLLLQHEFCYYVPNVATILDSMGHTIQKKCCSSPHPPTESDFSSTTKSSFFLDGLKKFLSDQTVNLHDRMNLGVWNESSGLFFPSFLTQGGVINEEEVFRMVNRTCLHLSLPYQRIWKFQVSPMHFWGRMIVRFLHLSGIQVLSLTSNLLITCTFLPSNESESDKSKETLANYFASNWDLTGSNFKVEMGEEASFDEEALTIPTSSKQLSMSDSHPHLRSKLLQWEGGAWFENSTPLTFDVASPTSPTLSSTRFSKMRNSLLPGKDDSKTKNPIKIVLTSDGPSEKKKHLKTSSDGKAKFKIAKRSSEERNLEDSSLPCKSLIELMEHNPQISGSMFEVTCVAFNDSTFELSITHWSSPEIEMSRKSYFPRLLLALESLLDGFYKTFEVSRLIVCRHCCISSLFSSGKAKKYGFEECSATILNEGQKLVCPESGLEVSVPFIAPDIGMRDVPHLGHLINELELIGEGATGQITIGEMLVNSKSLPVAVKQYKKLHIANKYVRAVSEASVLIQFSHPNLVSLYGITVKPFSLVMEFVSGGDLGQLLTFDHLGMVTQDWVDPLIGVHLARGEFIVLNFEEREKNPEMNSGKVEDEEKKEKKEKRKSKEGRLRLSKSMDEKKGRKKSKRDFFEGRAERKKSPTPRRKKKKKIESEESSEGTGSEDRSEKAEEKEAEDDPEEKAEEKEETIKAYSEKFQRSVEIPKTIVRFFPPPLTDTQLPQIIRLRIALDVARGLEALQMRSPPIVHRDLRPPNIFIVSLDPDAAIVAKIGDFGLAQEVFPLGGGKLLTWQWMAPEVLDLGLQCDERSDIYSFGMVLFEIMTRTSPFGKQTLPDQYVRGGQIDSKLCEAGIIHEELRPIIPANIDPRVSKLIQLCWAQNPVDRPSSTNIAAMIEELMAHRPPANVAPPAVSFIQKPATISFLPKGSGSLGSEIGFGKVILQIRRVDPQLNSEKKIEYWIGCSKGEIYWVEPLLKELTLHSIKSPHQFRILSLRQGSLSENGLSPPVISADEHLRVFIWDPIARLVIQSLELPQVQIASAIFWKDLTSPLLSAMISRGNSLIALHRDEISREERIYNDSFALFCGVTTNALELQTIRTSKRKLSTLVPIKHSITCFCQIGNSKMLWMAGMRGVLHKFSSGKCIQTWVGHSSKTITDLIHIEKTPQIEEQVWSCGEDACIYVWRMDCQIVDVLYRTYPHRPQPPKLVCLAVLDGMVFCGNFVGQVLVYDVSSRLLLKAIGDQQESLVVSLFAEKGKSDNYWIWTLLRDRRVVLWESQVKL